MRDSPRLFLRAACTGPGLLSVFRLGRLFCDFPGAPVVAERRISYLRTGNFRTASFAVDDLVMAARFRAGGLDHILPDRIVRVMIDCHPDKNANTRKVRTCTYELASAHGDLRVIGKIVMEIRVQLDRGQILDTAFERTFIRHKRIGVLAPYRSTVKDALACQDGDRRGIGTAADRSGDRNRSSTEFLEHYDINVCAVLNNVIVADAVIVEIILIRKAVERMKRAITEVRVAILTENVIIGLSGSRQSIVETGARFCLNGNRLHEVHTVCR